MKRKLDYAKLLRDVLGYGVDDTPLAFGKYKGKTPNKVALENPGYILWMVDNVNRELASQALVDVCEEHLYLGSMSDMQMHDHEMNYGDRD